MTHLGLWWDAIVRNAEPLWIGVLASVIVLALQVVVQTTVTTMTYALTSRLRLLRLYAFQRKSNICVVSGSVPREANPDVAFLAGPDATAAANIMQSLKNVYQESMIRHYYATGRQDAILGENVVTVGGPLFNSCTRHMLDNLPKEISFDKDNKLVFFGQTYSKEDGTQEDYGLVVRHSNPYATSRKVVVIAGCGSHGVLAASMLFDQTKRFASLVRDVGKARGVVGRVRNNDFACVVKCRVTGNEIASISAVALRSMRKT